MTAQIVLASRNRHKLQEISEILNLPVQLLSLADFPGVPEIEETGASFAENALLKAATVYHHTKIWTLADDSGLEVDALGGKPGIFSSRYSGKNADAARNNQKLLKALRKFPAAQRGAQFRCAVAIVGNGFQKVVEGTVRGTILTELRGGNGFGYDPLFVPQGYEQTFAELGNEVKNRISHRALALRKAAIILETLLR